MSWHCDKKNGRVIVDDSGRKVATANSTPWNPPDAWSNAKLIANAPEAVRLLRKCLPKLEIGAPVWSEVVEFLKANE